ncbi:MAG: protein tyrosine phosphatase [Bradyrhizobiaceae bacterium]|nr:MAG: protein tyrosine phosphatase [Bradyrhizobiaceae bacterium]
MTRDKFTTEDAVEMFASLAQPTRLEAYRLLVRYLPYGLPAGDVARLLAVPHNTMSTHLAQLERAGLITSRREGRSIIYAAKARKMASLFDVMLGEMRQPKDGEAPGSEFPQRRPSDADFRGYNVLILCSGNSARSLMAEAILNREGAGRFRAFSAGSRPQERPHPMAISLLDSLGFETDQLRSKSWDEFVGSGAPTMDFIITVCDAAAGEECPYWPGHPLQAHWGVPDPAMVRGTRDEKRAAFLDAYRRLAARLTALINLPIGTLDLAGLKEQLAAIGRMEGATELTLSPSKAA